MKIHRFFTTVIYIRSKCQKHIIGLSMNMNVFSWLYPFSNWERESGKQNLGVKEKCPKVTYLIFDGVPLENFLLSRATRLFLFLVLAWGILESLVSQLIFCLYPGVKWLWSVCHEPCSKTDLLLFTSAEGEGNPTSVLGSQPIIWLPSLSPSDVRRPDVT